MKSTNSKSAKRKPKAPVRKRAPRRRAAKATPVDPIAVLEEIARNKRLKPTPRVQAARELLRYRLEMLKSAPQADEQSQNSKSTKSDRFVSDLNERALQLLNPRGTA